MIEIKNLCKTYSLTDGSVEALKDVSLSIPDGDVFGIIGMSGAGKSTLVRCINMLERPTAGSVVIDGKDLTKMTEKELRAERQSITMIFQGFNLLMQKNCLRNVCFPLELAGVKKAEATKKAQSLLELVGLGDKASAYPAQLSGGQQQRVSMARALVKEPDVLLLDEPMSNLDARLKIEIRDEIRRVQQETGITSIIVTHDQEEAMAIADKIAILDNGRIQQYDTPEHLYHYPANLFVAKFMGNPPMNFIDAALSADGTRVEGAGFSLPLEQHMAQGGKKFAGHAVKVGVRSHLMAVHTEKVPQSMEMRLQIAENLGKEILISGMVGDSFVRVTVPENHDTFEQYKAISRSEKPLVYLTMTGVYNIFDTESGVNIALEK